MGNEISGEIYNSIRQKKGIALIQSFLDEGRDINTKNDIGETMLNYAAECGNMEVVEFLVHNGADAHIANYNGWKPCHMAAEFGHKDVVKFFLNIGIDIDSQGFLGETMLHAACVGGHVDTVRCLLSNKCDINAKNSCGFPPLHFAAMHSHFEIVKYLVEAGADVYCLSEDGRNALHVACFEDGLLDIVKYLIKKGCDPHVQDDDRETPLHCAVQSDNLEIIRHLLTVGADFNLENIRGKTPFSLFIRNPLCVEGIAIFLDKGAYFHSDDYNFIFNKPLLKVGILQNIKISTQSVLNKFNYSELPEIYERPSVARRLPPIGKMTISSHSNRAQHIADSVNYEIKAKGYCNVTNAHTNVLYRICVRSLAQVNGD